MMIYHRKTAILLIALLLLSAPFIFAHTKSQDDLDVEEQHVQSSNIVDISLISGIVTLILVILAVGAGRFMRKRKMKAKTHHMLAYITLVLALTHGIYNLFVHYILNSG